MTAATESAVLADSFARWESELAEQSAQPAFVSPVPPETSLRCAELGAIAQGLPMTPQGRRIAAVLEAQGDRPVIDRKTGEPTGRNRPLYKTVVVEVPRRSTKTTSIQNVLLGRCATIPGYRVVSTAQDGTRASAFFNEMLNFMEAETDEADRDWVGYRSQGREYIKWSNGSMWWVVKPEAGALRGRAADVMWFDEAGELDPTKSADLVAGALPIMDTKPNGQVIISGTPGKVRAGMFWTKLEAGRSGKPGTGIVDYAADEFCDPTDERVWWATHPGLASELTDIDIIRERFDDMGLPQFMREYLCIWPPDSTVTALDLKKWDITATDHLGAPPEGVPWGIGWDVAIGGNAAAVAVAWIDDNDEPHIQVMEHRAGAQWVAKNVAQGILKHPRVPVGYDSIGDNITVAQALGRMPKVRTNRVKALTLKDVAAATAQLANANELLTLHHAKHSGLDAAVKATTWRDSNGSRLFMRGKGVEITCLLACVHALAVAATAKRTAGITMPSASV